MDVYVFMRMYVCMYVCMYGCMHERVHECMHACMHACMHTCMHAFMHACRACSQATGRLSYSHRVPAEHGVPADLVALEGLPRLSFPSHCHSHTFISVSASHGVSLTQTRSHQSHEPHRLAGAHTAVTNGGMGEAEEEEEKARQLTEELQCIQKRRDCVSPK